MKNTTLIMVAILLSVEIAGAQTKGDTYHLPAIDVVKETKLAIDTKDTPLKYAVNTEITDVFFNKSGAHSGQWIQLFNGSWEFHLRFYSKGATSLNVGMKDFFLPPSAELWVSTDDQEIMRGPYDGSFNQKHGFFWVGDVPADHMNIKITVSDEYKSYLSFKVDNVTRGFYKYWEATSYQNKSGSCNVDVACSEGDDWEDQINSVGRYSFSTNSGSFVCSGQLINNTAQDGTPLFSTADHCGYSNNGSQIPLSDRENVAASMSITWNYQSLTCRAPGSSQSGTQISTSGFNDRQSGATYLASNPTSDFSLVRLNRSPNPSYGLEFTGWDRRDITPSGAVSIHHPAGHAKRISFENDPLSITTYLSTVRGAGTHWRVIDWDLGTTEGGSSGAGLWNPEKLFIGQLHGGFAACGNDSDDWYGRLFVSWETGNDAQSRLKDWLDPMNTGQETLQGTGGCEAPVVSIVNNSTNQISDQLTFTSSVTGGSGDYSYAWEINGDNGIDGSAAEIQARYNQQFVGNLNLTVTDSEGCVGSASEPVVIIGAEVKLQNVASIEQNLTQVCGNNDNVIDPGERWGAAISARNSGAITATDAYLALGKNRNAVTANQFDTYGNATGTCERLFIDISGTGTELEWQTASNVNNAAAADEGSVLIQLSQAIDHYGQNIGQLRASTNGFFSTSADATGGDWDNDCPLPETPDKDDNGARISPMHDDLKDADFYHQTFTSCPRAAEVGGDLACEVFLWQGADFFDTPNTVESIDVQAILYPATSQWVFQYQGEGFDGSSSTTGMQNVNATDGLTFACNTANSINTSDAVCIYNKNHLPSAAGLNFIRLESPVISLGDLMANNSRSGNLNFAITEDATCGTTFSINHDATVFDEGFNAGQENILTQTIGNGGQCAVVNNCGVGTSDNNANTNNLEPRRGLWWNPDRDGNGFDLYTIGDNRLVYYFYTGATDGEPVWYLANDANSSNNQYYNDITRYSAPGGFGVGELGFDVVGWSNTTFLDDSTAIQSREINGRISAEKQYFFQYGVNQTDDFHTGSWYTPSDSGWGHSIGTLGNARVAITYIFDNQGNPYWTIGNGPNDDSAFDVFYSNSFCPSCPAVNAQNRPVGSIKLTLDDQFTGTLDSYQISDEGVNWNESNLPVINLIPPNN